MKLRVWKWYHNWGDDTSTSLFSSEAAAIRSIHQYVEQQWEEGLMDDEEFSGIDQQDIQKYFECHDEEEWYSLDFQEVEFPSVPAVQEEDVILTSDECAVVVAALDAVNFEAVAEDMGITSDAAGEIIQSAYQKIKD